MKKPLVYLAANGMAAFMDFGVGVLIAIILARAMHLNDYLLNRALMGGMLALVPDLDIMDGSIVHAFTGKKMRGNHHASYLHWPLLVVPLVSIAFYWLGDLYTGLLACLCLLAHYLHDATMMGWPAGLVWLTRSRRTPINDPSFVLENGDWLEQKWLQPSMLAVGELLLGGFALALSIFLLTGTIEHLIIITLIPIGLATLVWNQEAAAKSW
jgi:hypothetical protein